MRKVVGVKEVVVKIVIVDRYNGWTDEVDIVGGS